MAVSIALTASLTLVPVQAAAASTASEPSSRATKTASTVLKSLKVSSERRAGYDRDLFQHWVDADGDGCDTREEVLLAESRAPTQTTTGCRITKGRWVSAYDRVKTKDPSTFDVDHMVPLAEAWDSGAYKWNALTREAFANDLDYSGSLIAVSGRRQRRHRLRIVGNSHPGFSAT